MNSAQAWSASALLAAVDANLRRRPIPRWLAMGQTWLTQLAKRWPLLGGADAIVQKIMSLPFQKVQLSDHFLDV